MNERTKLETRILRWVQAGLIDSQTGTRILAFEVVREKHASRRWPIILALAFGGILLTAGVTLFVAAHWYEMSPAMRFSLVLLMVAVFHVGGALASDRFPALATTLHAAGTATLGAGIYLAAQIFNLHENWPTGILLWAIGAALGFGLLRDWPQATALALLLPGWLITQWTITIGSHENGHRPLAFGITLTAICYLSALAFDDEGVARRALAWIGGISLLPCAAIAIGIVISEAAVAHYRQWPLPEGTLALGWFVAALAPIGLAFLIRGRSAWPIFAWALWVYLLLLAASHSEIGQSLAATVALYILCALGSVGLVSWGLIEKRRERVNLGVAGFAISVLFFYFDNFMGKMDRSLSLVILGVLCLAGGYGLEVTRRRLMVRMEAA